jgi:serine/threonine-protein kinase
MISGGPVGGGEMLVKLTDFGIARAIEQTRITQVGSVVGTAAYLAPEQVRGEEATPATDVYALGVVLYQFLTGRLPYEGSSLAELAVRQQNERPLPPSTYNEEVPDTFGAAVLRALEGDPGRRYASAEELSRGLQLGLEGEEITVDEDGHTRPTGVLGGDTAATRPLGRDTAATEYRPASPTRRPEPRVAPLPPPPVAAAPRQAPAQPRKRGGFSRFVRFVLALLVLIFVAAAVAIGVILLTDQAAGVKVGKVAGDTVDKVVEEVKGLVNENKE